jgi:hypothetical protein
MDSEMPVRHERERQRAAQYLPPALTFCTIDLDHRCFHSPHNQSNFRMFLASILNIAGQNEILRRCAPKFSKVTYVCHAERSEASRSSIRQVLLSRNEVLRSFAPQNDL